MMKFKALAGLLIFAVLCTLIWFVQLKTNEYYGSPFVASSKQQISELEMNRPNDVWHVREPMQVESFNPREYVKVIPRP
ncbi:hypothetical protein J9317_16335 [Metabacillus sp. KIGAM252]|uniref:Uncharacterized protein n=1 Tax=Metabacillus flavus TaxID=2823519 RepID=A0ABS5LHU1_9BACI|nr:hypothetical protein [Metabacillus flavus]MBS2970316.1 hypothetical protein [Metabacillus flavus]